MLPNFIVIGAMKGGTSSLYEYLRAHPQVFMSEKKELHFFCEDQFQQGLDWYERWFDEAGSARAVGEASTSYTMYPLLPGVPERMSEVVPDAKLIYLIREPLARIRSTYVHGLAQDMEDRPINEAVLADPRYLDNTRYAMQIDRYLGHFDREQLLVMKSEDLKREREQTLARILEFIGVDSTKMPDTIAQEANVGTQRQMRSAPLKIAQRLPGYGLLRRFAPESAKDAARRVTLRRVTDVADTELTPETEEKLLEELRPDLVRLREILGPDFDAWGIV